MHKWNMKIVRILFFNITEMIMNIFLLKKIKTQILHIYLFCLKIT